MYKINYLSVSIKAMILFFSILILGCEKDNPIEPDDGDYTLSVKYDSIRSYPGGGGIFVLSVKTDTGFTGIIKLSLQADIRLNAEFTESELDNVKGISNIELAPAADLAPGTYPIRLTARHNGMEKIKELKVIVYEWDGNIVDALDKLLPFKSWLQANKPQYNSLFTGNRKIYATYPQTLIVEHFTFLNSEYEMRLCYHVMIEPYDWSKICIRRLDKTEPELALMRDTNGDITVIPTQDYPTLYGY
jgi:hypothetical protein